MLKTKGPSHANKSMIKYGEKIDMCRRDFLYKIMTQNEYLIVTIINGY